MKVAVYGTLRKKGHNHSKLTEGIYLGKYTSEPIYSMYSINNTYPALTLKGNTSIVFEVYEVDMKTLKELDTLEGYGGHKNKNNHYNRRITVTPYGRAMIYTYNRNITPFNDLVPEGDWIEYNNFNKKINSYL